MPLRVNTLQFWFDFASCYSYVAALRIEEACANAGVSLEYKPFLLGPIFEQQLGIKDSPFNVHPERGQLRANTGEAQRLGVFGAPNFVIRGELFFGQDRMDDAIGWAATRAP